MSSPEKVVVARPLNNVAREVRIVRALYPQECLDQPTKPLDPASIAASPEPPPTYQNTGVQTLPPANGDVFRLIHGREPSHIDYARSMGSAGIGRFTDNPCSNHYDLMYGAAYPTPTTANSGAYTDSGFQTASHDASRKALARAKVKASMTANKYRHAASQAGYVICAESRDEMIVHSKQFSKAVQLDAEGNLLKGTVETRGLPNIYGALVRPTTPVPEIARRAVGHDSERLSRIPGRKERGVLVEQAPYPSPSQSPTMRTQVVTKELRNPVANVSALAPSSTGQAPDAKSVLDNEYGRAEPGINEHVVYDPIAEYSKPKRGSGAGKSSLGKRKSKADHPPISPPKKLKTSAPASPRSPSIPVVPPIATPQSQPDRDRKTPLRTPESSHKAISRSPQLARPRTGDVGQERALNVAQASTKPKLQSGHIASSATDEPRIQERKSRRKMSVAGSLGDVKVAARTEQSISSRTDDYHSHRPSEEESTLPRYARSTSRSSVPAHVSEIRGHQLSPERKGSNAANTKLASPRRK